MGWTVPEGPTARRFVGGIAILAVAGLLILLAYVFWIATLFGARGDDFQRFLLLGGLLVLVVAGFAAAAFTHATPREMVRAPAVWLLGLIVVGGALWAFVGIDSVRPVLALDEARLAYPGATETSRGTEPAKGGLGKHARASFTRSYLTTDSVEMVEAFFGSELEARGWSRRDDLELTRGDLSTEWRRDGFDFLILVPPPPWAGRFTVTIYGPRQ